MPETGLYEVELIVNYTATAAITVQLGGTQPPFFRIVRLAPTSNTLLSGNIPVLNVNIALLLNLNTILGTGQVSNVGIISLTAGDTIAAQYFANGFALSLNVNLSGQGAITSLAIRKISD